MVLCLFYGTNWKYECIEISTKNISGIKPRFHEIKTSVTTRRLPSSKSRNRHVEIPFAGIVFNKFKTCCKTAKPFYFFPSFFESKLIQFFRVVWFIDKFLDLKPFLIKKRTFITQTDNYFVVRIKLNTTCFRMLLLFFLCRFLWRIALMRHLDSNDPMSRLTVTLNCMIEQNS